MSDIPHTPEDEEVDDNQPWPEPSPDPDEQPSHPAATPEE